MRSRIVDQYLVIEGHISEENKRKLLVDNAALSSKRYTIRFEAFQRFHSFQSQLLSMNEVST
ncbi:MAG: hypothetical protein ACREQV_15445, partial [Candidatus Binatia bacterium]